MRFSLLWIVLLLGCCGLAGSATAGPASPEPAVWSGLFLATNEDHPKALPPEIIKYEEKMENIFGYNQYELVGEQSRKMRGPAVEHWLVPSKDFCLHVDTHQAAAGTDDYRMKMELFQNTHRLADFEARLGPESPLFIRGPLYAGGQLIIVLLVRE